MRDAGMTGSSPGMTASVLDELVTTLAGYFAAMTDAVPFHSPSALVQSET